VSERHLKKKTIGADVLTMARGRFQDMYRRFDRCVVSFSGGKDSTVVLNLALEAAAEAGRLPVEAFFWDEEAIHPETVEYVERVRQDPRVSLRWLCLPVKHRNGCSRRSPWWYPWAPEDEEKWCRPLPACAETTLKGFTRQTIPESEALLFPRDGRSVAVLTGIRADESLRRMSTVLRRAEDNYLCLREGAVHWFVKPIYDWTSEDVWLAPYRLGWDYNRAYDKMQAIGLSRSRQRVAPPYGEEPMQNLEMYAVCWPALWERMVARVPGAATAARYARTDLYAYGGVPKPEGRSWQEMVQVYLERHTPESRAIIANRLKNDILVHNERTGNAPIPEEEYHPDSGCSWKYLAMVACRGDLKRRRTMQKNLGR
jgi:predicted phosphoadenosine phosphosulfate sulfurtransferase